MQSFEVANFCTGCLQILMHVFMFSQFTLLFLQTVQFLMVSLEFFIDIILSVACHWLIDA
jgi:hypothetical protein